MKTASSFLALSTFLIFGSSCSNHHVEQQPRPTGLLQPEAFLQSDQYNQALDKLAKISSASEQSGLTALIVTGNDAHTWQEVDVYYQKAGNLPYSDDIKRTLKEKAMFGLVAVHGFLDKAPLEKRLYYADQFFGQQHLDPKVAIAFLENLRKEWPAEKLAAAKARTSQQLQADMERATRKVPATILWPDTEEVKKALASVEKEQLAQAQRIEKLQQRLAVL